MQGNLQLNVCGAPAEKPDPVPTVHVHKMPPFLHSFSLSLCRFLNELDLQITQNVAHVGVREPP